MATVSIRVPDELKNRMQAHEEINWSAQLRADIESTLVDLDQRNVAHAVATSEQLSRAIDAEEVEETNSAELIRDWRDTRYGAMDQ